MLVSLSIKLRGLKSRVRPMRMMEAYGRRSVRGCLITVFSFILGVMYVESF